MKSLICFLSLIVSFNLFSIEHQLVEVVENSTSSEHTYIIVGYENGKIEYFKSINHANNGDVKETIIPVKDISLKEVNILFTQMGHEIFKVEAIDFNYTTGGSFYFHYLNKANAINPNKDKYKKIYLNITMDQETWSVTTQQELLVNKFLIHRGLTGIKEIELL